MRGHLSIIVYLLQVQHKYTNFFWFYPQKKGELQANFSSLDTLKKQQQAANLEDFWSQSPLLPNAYTIVLVLARMPPKDNVHDKVGFIADPNSCGVRF